MWSFGLILNEMLTGEAPYVMSMLKLSQAMQKGLKPPICEKATGSLKELLDKCIEFDAAARWRFNEVLPVIQKVKEDYKTDP